MNDEIWKSKSGRAQFSLAHVIGFRYWPANLGNPRFTYGGLDVVLSGGKIPVPLDDGGDELFALLKERWSK